MQWELNVKKNQNHNDCKTIYSQIDQNNDDVISDTIPRININMPYLGSTPFFFQCKVNVEKEPFETIPHLKLTRAIQAILWSCQMHVLCNWQVSFIMYDLAWPQAKVSFDGGCPGAYKNKFSGMGFVKEMKQIAKN